MRKFLVIMFLVALIPFALGCRIGGGIWGFDDENGTAVGSTTTYNFAIPVTIPAAGVTKAFAQVIADDDDFSIKVGGQQIGPHKTAPTEVTRVTSGINYVYTFTKSILQSSVSTTAGVAKLELYSGTTLLVSTNISLTSSTTGNVSVSTGYTATVDASGTWTIGTTTSTGTGTGSGTGTGTGTSTATTTNDVTLQTEVSMDESEIDTTGSSIPSALLKEVELYITIGGVQIGPYAIDGNPYKKTKTGTKWFYHYLKKVAKTAVTIDTLGNSVFKVFSGGSVIFTGTLPVSTTASTGATTASNTYTITLTKTGGTWSATVTYVAPTATTTTPISVTQPTQTPRLYVESLDYLKTGTSYYALSDATTVPFTSPKIRVTFNSEVDKATDTFQIDFTNLAGTKVSLTQADIAAGLLSATSEAANSQTTLTFQLTGTNASRLKPNTKYTATFNSSSAVLKGDNTVKVETYGPVSFTTNKISMSSWQALNGSVVVGTSTGGTVTTAADKIEITFDYPVTLPTNMSGYTFTKTVGTTVSTTLKYTDYFGTPTADTTGKVVTIPLTKTLGKGVYKDITLAGTFTDIDTTNTVTFTVQ